MSSVASRGAGFGGDEGNFGVAFGVIGHEGNVGIALDDEELVVVGAAAGVFGDPIAGTNLTVELVGDVLFSAVGGCALGIAFTGEAVEEEEFAVVVNGMSVGDVPVVTKVGEPVCVPEEATGIVTSSFGGSGGVGGSGGLKRGDQSGSGKSSSAGAKPMQ